MTNPIGRCIRRGLVVVSLATAGLAAQDDRPSTSIEFERDVLPILREHCFECHQAPAVQADGRTRKPKGGLRLDGSAWIDHGGDGGPILDRGDAASSELIIRIRLPADDPDVMPSEGDPLTAPQIEMLERWIAAGAGFGTWTGSVRPNDAPAPPRALPVTTRARVLEALAVGLPQPSDAVLQKAAGAHGRIVGALGDDRRLLSVSFPAHREGVDDAAIRALGVIAPQIAELDLARSTISDAAFETIAKMPRLTRLDLSGTPVTSRGITRLARLENLRSLNLVATKVDDAAIDSIAKLAGLEVVYVWQAAISPAGLERLHAARQELRIVSALDLPAPPPGDDGDGSRRRRR